LEIESGSGCMVLADDGQGLIANDVFVASVIGTVCRSSRWPPVVRVGLPCRRPLPNGKAGRMIMKCRYQRIGDGCA